MRARPSEAGFTLVEMLVALALFAAIAGMGAMMLRGSVESQGRVQDRLGAMSGVQRLRAIMTEDLGQAAARWTRDAQGANVPPFLGEADRMAFVLSGGGADGQAAARVEYALVEGRWQRAEQPRLDGAAMPAAGDALAADVTRAALRYRDAAGVWHDRWPVDGGAVALPRAVKLRIEQGKTPAVVMLFLVGVQP